MAAAAACRCFALSYDPKVSQLMAEFDWPGWELAGLPDDANVISKAWLECYANGEPLSAAKIGFLRDRAQIHGELFLKLQNR
jgi:polysaccharide pyruvyl transferase WcaK-like protein